MSQWKNSVSMLVLCSAAALVGTGCLAQGPDDQAADEPAVVAAGDQAVTGAEKTGAAQEACGGFGGWGGFGGCGCFGGCPFAHCGFGGGLWGAGGPGFLASAIVGPLLNCCGGCGGCGGGFGGGFGGCF